MKQQKLGIREVHPDLTSRISWPRWTRRCRVGLAASDSEAARRVPSSHENGTKIAKGTIVAPRTSVRPRAKGRKRNPEMHQTRKGHQ
jgi:hypothetical protein